MQQPTTNDVNLDDPGARLELVRRVWREVLATAEIGDDVSFFDAGGDSLRLVILAERLGQESGRNLRTVELFRAGTVRGQAELLAAQAAPAGPAATGGPSGREQLLQSVRNRRGSGRG